MKSTVQILKDARELIRKGWTRNRYASDRSGRTVDIESPYACRFCSLGAIRKATGDKQSPYPADQYVALAVGGGNPRSAFGSVAIFNDDEAGSKVAVIRAFDEAIKLAEQEAR